MINLSTSGIAKSALRLLGVTAVFAGALSATNLRAQAYPTKPILVVSTASPGSSGDAGLRMMVAKMSESMGQPVLVELRTAAGGAQAYAVVSKAAPDGHTITFGASGVYVYRRFLFKNMAFDILKDYVPISMSFNSPSYIGVPKSMGINTLQEFIDHVKKNPGKLSYGSTGNGSYFHLATEALKSAAGIDLLHIPYAQANFPQLRNDWASGRISLWLTTYASFGPIIDQFRMLAVIDNKRSAQLPDVAPITDLLPGYDPFVVWWGFFGPPGLPDAIANRVAAESRRAMLLPDVLPRLEKLGMGIVGSTPEELGKLLRADINAIGKIVKEIGLNPG